MLTVPQIEFLCPARNAEAVPLDRLTWGVNSISEAAESTWHFAMLWANICQETDYLKTMREYHDGSDYEFRSDLGNDLPGDGVKYPGRGAIMLTGKTNYKRFAEWKWPDDADRIVDFLEHPQQLECHPYCWQAAVFYYRTRIVPNFMERDFEWFVRLINGGTKGWRERSRMYVATGLLLLDWDMGLTNGVIHPALTDVFIKRFQDHEGLVTDGIFGPKTDAAMRAQLEAYDVSPAPVLTPDRDLMEAIETLLSATEARSSQVAPVISNHVNALKSLRDLQDETHAIFDEMKAIGADIRRARSLLASLLK